MILLERRAQALIFISDAVGIPAKFIIVIEFSTRARSSVWESKHKEGKNGHGEGCIRSCHLLIDLSSSVVSTMTTQ